MASRSMMMKHQQGAALIVVLSLLTISLMVGLSSIQSSQINEKLSVNYKAQAETVMNAETGLSAFFSQYQECDEIKGAIDAGFLSPDGGDEYELGSASTVDVNSGHFDIYMLGFSDNRIARAMVKAKGVCEVPLSFLRSRGAFVCPAGACGFEQGASINGGVSGFDHSLMDTEDGGSCDTETADDPQHRAGAIFTDVAFSSQGYTEEDIDNLNVEGDPNYLAAIDFDGDGHIDAEYLDAFFQAGYMSDLFDDVECADGDNECRSNAVKGAMEEIDNDGQAIIEAVEAKVIAGKIVDVNEGDTFTVDGRFDGVINMNGGTLILKGNSCVVGAVVGGGDTESANIESSGRPSVIGTIVSSGNLNFTGKGRPDVSFSSEVLLALDEEISLTIQDFYLTEWEDHSGSMDGV